MLLVIDDLLYQLSGINNVHVLFGTEYKIIGVFILSVIADHVTCGLSECR